MCMRLSRTAESEVTMQSIGAKDQQRWLQDRLRGNEQNCVRFLLRGRFDSSTQLDCINGRAALLPFGIFVCVTLLFSTLAVAQGGATGAIAGTVQDESGALISGA